jgi:hypothetical protein
MTIYTLYQENVSQYSLKKAVFWDLAPCICGVDDKLKLTNVNQMFIDFKIFYEILTKDCSKFLVIIMNFNKFSKIRL